MHCRYGDPNQGYNLESHLSLFLPPKKTAARIRLHKYFGVGCERILVSGLHSQIEYTFSALEMNNNTDANATYLNPKLNLNQGSEERTRTKDRGGNWYINQHPLCKCVNAFRYTEILRYEASTGLQKAELHKCKCVISIRPSGHK